MAGRRWRDHTCDECGTPFQRRQATPRFCSQSCPATYQHRDNVRPAFVCEGCGASFTVSPSLAQQRMPRFCSKECYEAMRAVRGVPVDRRCERYGTAFGAPLWQFDRVGYQDRFCSIACCNAAHIGVRRCPRGDAAGVARISIRIRHNGSYTAARAIATGIGKSSTRDPVATTARTGTSSAPRPASAIRTPVGTAGYSSTRPRSTCITPGRAACAGATISRRTTRTSW